MNKILKPTETANETAFRLLVEEFGKAGIARMAGITPQALSKWKAVPGARAQAIADASKWPVDKIRPEPYANP